MYRRRLRLAGLLGQAVGLLDDLVDVADHVEGDLRKVVVLAAQDLLEAGDGLLHRHQLARVAGEHLGDLDGGKIIENRIQDLRFL